MKKEALENDISLNWQCEVNLVWWLVWPRQTLKCLLFGHRRVHLFVRLQHTYHILNKMLRMTDKRQTEMIKDICIRNFDVCKEKNKAVI